MKARVVIWVLSVFAICMVTASWGMPPKKKKRAPNRLVKATQCVEPIDAMVPSVPVPVASAVAQIPKDVDEELIVLLARLSLGGVTDPVFSCSDTFQPLLSVEWPGGHKTFSAESASWGIRLDSHSTATLGCHLLPGRPIKFDEADAPLNEYVFIFPEHGLLCSEEDPIWVQLVLDFPPEIKSCLGCGKQPVVHKLRDGQNQYVIAFPIEPHALEVRLEVQMLIPDGCRGLVSSSSALLTTTEAVYLSNLPSKENPQTPVLFGYRQTHSDRVVIGGFVKDFSIKNMRPHTVLPPSEKEPWLGASRDMKLSARVLKHDHSLFIGRPLLEARKRAEKWSSLATRILDQCSKQVEAEVLDKYVLPMKDELLALSGRLDFHHRYLADLLSGSQFLQRELNHVTLHFISNSGRTSDVLPNLKNQMIAQSFLDADSYLQSLAKAYIYALAALIVVMDQSQDMWLKDNLGVVLKGSLKLMYALMELYDVSAKLTNTGSLGDQLTPYGNQKKYYDLIFNLTNGLVEVGSLYSYEEVFLDDPPSEFEIKAMEEFGEWVLTMAISYFKTEVSMAKSKEHLYQLGGDFGSQVVSILNYALIIQSSKLFEKALKLLFKSYICLKNLGTEKSTYIEAGKPSAPGGVALVAVMSEKGRRDWKDVSRIIGCWGDAINTYTHKVLKGHIVPTDRGLDLIRSISWVRHFDESFSQNLTKRALSAEDVLSAFQDIPKTRMAVDQAVRTILADQYRQELEDEEEALFARVSGEENLTSVQIELADVTQASQNKSVSGPGQGDPELSQQEVHTHLSLWRKAMHCARMLASQKNYTEADLEYERCIGLANEDDVIRAYSLIEGADNALAPWRSMLFDLEPSFVTIRQFQDLVDKVDRETLQSLFSTRLGLSFGEYQAVVRETPFPYREKIDVPTHAERMKFWLAVKCVRNRLVVPDSVLTKAISNYKQAMSLLEAKLGEHENILMYRKVLEWLIRVSSQDKEARVCAESIKPLSTKLVDLLKIIGTYGTGSLTTGVSWKTILVKEVSSLGKTKKELKLGELGIFDLLNKQGLSESYDWMLLPHQKLVWNQSQGVGGSRRALAPSVVASALWDGKTPEELKAENVSSLMLIGLGHGKGTLKMRVARRERMLEFQGKSTVTDIMDREFSKGHPSMIVACRSGSRDALCDELSQYTCLATPIRIRKHLTRRTAISKRE